MDVGKPKKRVPPVCSEIHFSSFVFASPSLECQGFAPPRPKHMAGMNHHICKDPGQQPCQRSWARCRGNPPRGFVQSAIVLPRLGWLGSQGGSEMEQWPAASSCADDWAAGGGAGEQRPGRWWLLSSPRLAGPITARFSMTELTPLSFSEGERKIHRVKRLQHWLHEIKKVSSSLPAPNAIRTTSCSVVSQVPYYFHAWPPKFYQRCFICSQ